MATTKVTRTTKNVNVKPSWNGFVVSDNYEVITTTKSVKEAKDFAIALAKKENKGVYIQADYWTEKISAKKVQTNI